MGVILSRNGFYRGFIAIFHRLWFAISLRGAFSSKLVGFYVIPVTLTPYKEKFICLVNDS